MADENDKPAPPAPVAAPASNAGAEGDDRWRRRAEDAERELAVRRALQGIDWFDPEDAYRELASHAVRAESGAWEIAWPASENGESRRASPAEAARELAAHKPHWIRARVLGGSGAGDGIGGAAAHGAGVTYADLLRPENRDKLRDYLYERPGDLERLRQEHFRV